MYAYFSKNSQKQVKNIDNIYNIHIGQEPENTANAQKALADYIEIIREEKRHRSNGNEFATLAQEIKKQKGYGG